MVWSPTPTPKAPERAAHFRRGGAFGEAEPEGPEGIAIPSMVTFGIAGSSTLDA